MDNIPFSTPASYCGFLVTITSSYELINQKIIHFSTHSQLLIEGALAIDGRPVTIS
jgi:hypothetical protein